MRLQVSAPAYGFENGEHENPAFVNRRRGNQVTLSAKHDKESGAVTPQAPSRIVTIARNGTATRTGCHFYRLFLAILFVFFVSNLPQARAENDDLDRSRRALDEKYWTYKEALLKRHLSHGLVVNVCLDRPGGKVIERHFGDSTLWTGVLLGTLALEYHHTGEEETLEQIREILNALSRLQIQPGYVVRTDRGEEAGTRLAEPSAGQYMGVLFGYDLAFKYVEDPSIRAKIREDVEKISRYLEKNWYILFRPIGGFVDRGPNGVIFEYVWSKIFERIVGDPKPSPPIEWKILWQQLDREWMDVDGWLALFAKLFPARLRYTLCLENAIFLHRWLGIGYFNLHLAFLSAYSALAHEANPDPEVLAAFKKLYRDVQKLPGDENALFAAMAKAILEAADQQTEQAINTLKDFPDQLPNNWQQIPYRQDNAWQRRPEKRSTPYIVYHEASPCRFIEYPGLDYLLPSILLLKTGPGRGEKSQQLTTPSP